jgi:hypothetical protein
VFIAVSTLSNSILWLTPSGEVTRTWQADGEGDAWHLNSLFPVNGTVVAAAFGRFSKHREWSNGRAAGAGIVFDLLSGADLVSGLSCPHDPRLVDGSWVVCNSGERELVVADASSGAITRRIGLQGWTRGLAVDELASVAVIDRRTWSVVDRLPLPCQEVFDVVQVPAPLARGLRQGFRTNPLRTAEQDQHALFREAGVRPSRLWAVGEPLPAGACRVRVSVDVPEVVEAGTVSEYECTIANLGDAILVSAPPNPVHISYRWTGAGHTIEGARSVLAQTLPPGTEQSCRFSLRAPEAPGEYGLTVTLVQEHVAWFDHLDERNAWSRRVRVV